MYTKNARFRFYAELNDFLPGGRRQVDFDYAFNGRPSIKDAIEAIGVPHSEVDLVVVNGASVGWDYHLGAGDDVAVYPVFEATDISPIVHLRPEPLRVPRFVLDAHLGRLAHLLRMLGFDANYDPRRQGASIVDMASREHRIILTRNRELLKDGRVTHGYWVRATGPRAQIEEVVARLDLRARFAPFTRCMECNGEIDKRPVTEVPDQVPEKARAYAHEFHMCSDCGKIYWDGTHVEQMRELVDDLRRAAD